MQNVQTGYIPEFGLGAVYAGQNAADTQTSNQLDILKAFLANQREQQIQPLDVQVKQWDAASAQDKLNDPEYREWLRKGYIGQMQSQDAAGNTAQVLAPFKQKAEQTQLENDYKRNNVLGTLMDIDSKLNQGGSPDEQGNIVPFTDQDKSVLGKLRQRHIEQLANTPEFYQKQSLQNDRLDSAENLALLKMQNAIKLQELKAQIKQDPKTAEAVMASLLTKQQSGVPLTSAEKEVWDLAAAVVERKAPETKPGTTLDVGNPKLKNAPLKENESRTPIIRMGGGSTGRGAGSSSGTTKSGNKFTVEKQEK